MELDALHPIFREVADAEYPDVRAGRWTIQNGYVYAWMPCLLVRQPCTEKDWAPEGPRTPQNMAGLFRQSTLGEAIAYPELRGDDYEICPDCENSGSQVA